MKSDPKEGAGGGAARPPLSDGDLEQDIDDEFQFHLEMRARELRAQGLDPNQARRQAALAFGDRSRTRSECLELRRSERRRRKLRDLTRTLVADTAGAARGLARRPGFSILAVLTLAVGVGAVTAIFSLVDATLLRPLPYPDSDRIVTVWETHPAQPRRSVAPANFLDWQERSRTLTQWSAISLSERTLTVGSRPLRVSSGSVSNGFFETLGARPPLGQSFGHLDPGTDGPSAILGHSLWQREFGSDGTVVGRTVRVDGAPYRVVAVAPAGFEYPRGVEFWTWSRPGLPEAPPAAGDVRQIRDAHFIAALARLEPRVDLASARAEMDGIAASLRAEYPVENLDAGVLVLGLQDYLVAGFRTTVLLLLAAVGLVLIIACANVANLLLVRAIERRKESAVRSALGASGGRLLLHHLGEGLALAAGGAALGVLFAGLVIRGAGRWSWAWGDTPLRLDLSALLVVVVLTGMTTLIFGALPALLVRWTPTGVFGGRGTGGGGDRNAGRVRRGLLVIEVALAFALVLSTGLTVRTVLNLRSVDLGFDPTRLATVRVFLGPEAPDAAARARTLGEIERTWVADVGVASVGVARVGPLVVGAQAGLRVEGRAFAPGEDPDVGWQFVSDEYFATYRIPIVRGRSFTVADRSDAAPVAIINAALAEQVFRDVDPVGQRINTGLDGPGVWVEVVGVAADTRNRGPAEASFPTLYRPMTQGAGRGALLAARLRSEPDAATLARLEGLARTAAPDAAVTAAGTGADLVAPFTRGTQTTLVVLGALATLALLLSAIGLYGVTSYSVSRRTRDLGIRLALGARPSAVVGQVLADSLRPSLAGLAIGLVASMAVAWELRRMLFEVAPFDPLTIAAVAVVMVGVCVLASLIPAVRAAAVDPAATLRE